VSDEKYHSLVALSSHTQQSPFERDVKERDQGSRRKHLDRKEWKLEMKME
jgi:hypothetical protein